MRLAMLLAMLSCFSQCAEQNNSTARGQSNCPLSALRDLVGLTNPLEHAAELLSEPCEIGARHDPVHADMHQDKAKARSPGLAGLIRHVWLEHNQIEMRVLTGILPP